ncbi:MAG: GntR family transcriptional regulator [Victivallales bacterium]
MLETLDRETVVSLPSQLKDIIRKRIEAGYYTSGRKIDSVRKIAREFGVSSLTVQRALKLLEAEDYVTSVPASGVFVNDKPLGEIRTAKIVLVFPEATISKDILDPEIWGLSSEIYRGLLSGAKEYGAQISFVHVAENLEPLQEIIQLKQLKQYDAAVFSGVQLLDFQLKLAQEISVFQIGDEPVRHPEIIRIDYDRLAVMETLVRHARDCCCHTAGVISYYGKNEKEKHFKERAAEFLSFCKQYGIATDEKFNWEFDEATKGELSGKLNNCLPDFMFCNHAYFVTELYEKCAANHIRIGKDVKLAAIASGATFAGLIPSLTYVRVPMFELTQDIVKKACMLVRDEVPVSKLEHFLVKAPLVKGKSTVISGGE